MYVARSGTTEASGVDWIAGVIFAGICGANALYASFAKICRDEIDGHGDIGTARMTSTEARWSPNYDNQW